MKPILCLDFDGVLHSYESGWKGAEVIPDPPVPGALDFLERARHEFQIAIFSSRSNQPLGISAMRFWLMSQMHKAGWSEALIYEVVAEIQFPTEKPPALVTIDDRAITFTGEWPSLTALKAFEPWNKKPSAGREE